MELNLGAVVEDSFRALRKSIPLTVVRISPAGALGIVFGTASLAATIVSFAAVPESPLLRKLVNTQTGLTLPLLVYSSMLYAWGIIYYNRALRLMSYPTARKHMGKIVTDNVIYWYCMRQAHHAAAVRSGLSSEFENVMSEYRGVKRNAFLPRV